MGSVDGWSDASGSIESEQISEKDKTTSKARLCRGPGHVRECQYCFYTDDRFGRHYKCKRECDIIDGVWGPTVCCAECRPESPAEASKENSRVKASYYSRVP